MGNIPSALLEAVPIRVQRLIKGLEKGTGSELLRLYFHSRQEASGEEASPVFYESAIRRRVSRWIYSERPELLAVAILTTVLNS